MNRILEQNEILSIKEKPYTILGLAGVGASCVVYKTKAPDETIHLIKEYNPRKFDLSRSGSGELFLDTTDEETIRSFESGLNHFCEGAKKQIHLRASIPELMNQTSNAEEYVETNGTAYIIMSVLNGMVYSDYQENSLYDLLKRMKTLASVIGYYHNNGYLHLDIKPDNIFVLPETCEIIQLFDFDSVVKKEDLFEYGVSYTNTWAAPEQLCPAAYNDIAECTDIFAIGEIIFYKLFGRHSTRTERRSFSDYDFSKSVFQVEPVVGQSLTNLFHRTICINPKSRFFDTVELIKVLDELVKITDYRKPHLVSTNILSCDYFIGRDKELLTINEMLDREDILFVTGLGGIGKSELVRHYANQYKNEYDYIYQVTFNTNWVQTFINDRALSIANFTRFMQEDDKQYFNRKIDCFKDLCTKRTLLIIDNCNEEFQENDYRERQQILSLGCKVLITSRMERNYPSIHIDTLSNENDLRLLFEHWYQASISEYKLYVDEIIRLSGKHLLLVELIAKQAYDAFLSPKEMLDAMRLNGIFCKSTEIILEKDYLSSNDSVCRLVSALFSLDSLTDEQKKILLCLAFFPIEGVQGETFLKLSEKNQNDLSKLKQKGWITRTSNVILMHPIIQEVIFSSLSDKLVWIDEMLMHIKTNYEEDGFVWDSTRRMEYDAIVRAIFNNSGKYHLISQGIVDFMVSQLWVDQEIFPLAVHEKRLGELAKEFSADWCNQDIVINWHITMAAILFWQDKNDEALNTLQKVDNLLVGIVSEKSQLHKHLKAQILAENGEFDTAYSIFDQLLLDCSSMGNSITDYESQIKILTSYSRTLRDGSKLDASLEKLEKALAICSEIYKSEENRVYAEIYKEFYLCYYNKGNILLQEEYLNKAIHIMKKIVGEDSIAYIGLQNLLGNLYADTAQYELAIECLERVLLKRIEWYGPKSQYVANTYDALAFSYQKTDQYKKAELCFEKSLEINRTLNPINTIRVLNIFGRYYYETGKLDLAESLLEEACAMIHSEGILSHYLAADNSYYRAMLCYCKQRYDEALSLAESSYQLYIENNDGLLIKKLLDFIGHIKEALNDSTLKRN